LDIALTEKSKIVTFDVNKSSDWSQKIQNAVIYINGETFTTDHNGCAKIPLISNTYDYTVKANGYHVLSDDIPIADDDWFDSGRLASDEEQERLAMLMEQETDGEELEIVFDRLFKKFSV